MSSRKKMAMYLNLEAEPLESGYLPDYNGLAELIGFEYIEIQNFARDKNPTCAVLHEWGNRPLLQPTLGKLIKYLIQLERHDVLNDCKAIFREDADNFLSRSRHAHPVQDETVSQSRSEMEDEMDVDETAIISIQDVAAGRPTFYDAFVCYNYEPEGDDLKFVLQMIEKLECPPHSLKLFVPHRDDLPGASKHVISAKLIQDRCKRMVIVMSPKYLRSPECDFQTKFAHALSPGSRSKKLVPVLVKNCETPNILRHVTMCDFTRGDLTGWFWERLIKSLQAPLNPSEISLSSSSNLSDIEINVPPSKLGFSSPASSQVVASASPLCSGPVSSASAVHGHSLKVSSLTSGSGPVQAADCMKAISQTDYISVQRSSSLSSLTSSTPSSPASSRRKIVTPDKNQPSGSASKKSGKLMSKLQSVFSSHSSSNS
ncbi:myeloid differentiation primary response protein MyD88-like isoform X2 [Pomacea canaliculata]|nr:myeloid differentiation primary response protein MyD88-like isoform X2 [Pomacea canaliculata]